MLTPHLKAHDDRRECGNEIVQSHRKVTTHRVASRGHQESYRYLKVTGRSWAVQIAKLGIEALELLLLVKVKKILCVLIRKTAPKL